MTIALFAQPKMKLMMDTISLSERVVDLERRLDQLLTESGYRPNKSVSGIVDCIVDLAKRNDPLLVSYSVYLAKTVITMKVISDLLDKKKDRTSIILKDIFHKVDASLIRKNMIQNRADILDSIDTAIDRSFATRKMKNDLKRAVDDLYDVVERKVGSQSNELRQLSTVIKRSGLSSRHLDEMQQHIANYLQR